MGLYGTSLKYGQGLFGNQTYLTTLGTQTQDFLDAQQAEVRKVTGLIIINSHFQQYGRNITSDSVIIGGTGKERLAQSFIAPRTMNITEVQIPLKTAYAGNVDDIKISIYIGTSISTGTIVGSTTIPALNNFNTEWNKAVFNNVVGLLAGTTYWITAQNALDSTEENYGCSDITTAGDFISAKYVGTTWGTSNSVQYVSRIKSDTEAENDKTIEGVISFKLIRDVSVPTYSFTAHIVNDSQKYSSGQIYSDYMLSGNDIKAFVGFEVNGQPQYYQIFRGITENNPSTKSIVSLSAKCFMSKLMGDYTSSDALGGLAYENIIQTIARRSGIEDFRLTATGKTSTPTLSFANMTTSDIIEQVRESTLERMQFYNNITLYTTPRVKKTLSNNIAPLYYIRDTDFLIDADTDIVTDKMINRITVTNDEEGETTSDGNTIKVGDYRTIGTATISLGSSTASGTLGITFTHGTIYGKPTIFMDWSKDNGLVRLEEISRSCGNSITYGSISFNAYNKNYGVGNGTATITVYGCPISNAGANTKLVEVFDQDSYESYGKYSKRVDNKIFASIADETDFANDCLNEYSQPMTMIKMNTKGIVNIYPDDLLGVVEPTRLKLNNLCITKLSELSWNAYPASLRSYIEAEKTNYGLGLTYILQEDGNYILQEDGYKIFL